MYPYFLTRGKILCPHVSETSPIDDKLLTKQEKYQKSTADFPYFLRSRCDSLPDHVSSALECEYMYSSVLGPYRRHEALQIVGLRKVEISAFLSALTVKV